MHAAILRRTLYVASLVGKRACPPILIWTVGGPSKPQVEIAARGDVYVGGHENLEQLVPGNEEIGIPDLVIILGMIIPMPPHVCIVAVKLHLG
jgi:hypothetical protein